MPSRKWFAARVTALTALAVLVATSGWHTEATIMFIGIVSEGLLAWLTPNRSDPVPPVHVVSRRS